MDQTSEFYEKDPEIRHTLKESLHTLSGMVSEFEEGYRFDDAEAAELIEYFKSSIRFITNYFYSKGILSKVEDN